MSDEKWRKLTDAERSMLRAADVANLENRLQDSEIRRRQEGLENLNTIADLLAEVERLRAENTIFREALTRIRSGFDKGIFQRTTERDDEEGWAITFLPYLQALAVGLEP